MKNNNQTTKNTLILVWSLLSLVAAWCSCSQQWFTILGLIPYKKIRQISVCLLIPFKRKIVEIFKLSLDFISPILYEYRSPWGFQSFGESPLHCGSVKGLGLLLVYVYRFGNWRQEQLWLNQIRFFLLRQTGLSACIEVCKTCPYPTRKMFLHSSASPLLFGISLLCHVLGSDLEGKALSATKSFMSGCLYWFGKLQWVSILAELPF